MARKRTGQQELFDETENLIALLHSDDVRQAMVILAVPSHDRRNQPLPELKVKQWASDALELFADNYRGATAYETYRGIFKTDAGEYLHDRPILIESFASQDAIEDSVRLNNLVGFAKRMGKALNQAAVMIVVSDVMFYIEKYDD